MLGDVPRSFLEQAQFYAAWRWLWKDDTFIQELYECRFPEDGVRTPEQWIDEMAEDFDLADPKEYMFDVRPPEYV